MGVRDPLLNEALRRLAAEASTRFATLVASGDQIPFDVAEQAGEDAFFHSYVPLTGRYVREREAEIRSLPGFGSAREAVDAAGVAATYLEQRGEVVVADAAERAAHALTVFLASLWDGSSHFSLDRERLDVALAALDAEVGDVDEADVLVVPIAGLQMAPPRLQLPHGMRIVRADTFDAPLEAKRSEGMGRAAWEPQFLAVAELGEGSDSTASALNQLGELISVMRLFKAGGVALGPYAFVQTAEGSWRRVATGAPAPRAGSYRLSEEEAAELADLANALEARPDPSGPLSWAVRRFELGCERASAPEGLSDHLLALRAVLDGQGPVGASLPMRAAALVADGSEDRLAVRERIEAALELERAQMTGASVEASIELAGWMEGSVRRILRQAALGDLGSDLNEAAEETLIAAGLGEGDAEIAVAPPVQPELELEPNDLQTHEPEVLREPAAENHASPLEEENMEDTRILEPVPAEDEIRITATNWLDEVEVGEDAGTIEWPAGGSDVEHRERIDTPRVRHLFPVPEDADWEIRELTYDHYDRRRAG
jgi:hypothetical protein